MTKFEKLVLLLVTLALLVGVPTLALAQSLGEPFARDPAEDFNTLALNTNPEGIWSDGTTMWVADSFDDKIYAYSLATKARDSGKDFDTLAGAGNNFPEGIWSDGTTMWVADWSRRQDIRLQPGDQGEGLRQGLRHPGRRRKQQPGGHLVRRDDHVGGGLV